MQPWHFWGPNLFEGLRLKPCLNPALTGPPTLSCVYAVNGVVADDSFFAMADGRRRRHSSMDRFLRLIIRTKHFRWWSVFGDHFDYFVGLRLMSSDQVLIILVTVWRKSINFWRRYEDKKTIFTFLPFRSQWPWPLTFRPQICSTSYSGPALISTKIEASTAFLFREYRTQGTRTGRRTESIS